MYCYVLKLFSIDFLNDVSLVFVSEELLSLF